MFEPQSEWSTYRLWRKTVRNVILRICNDLVEHMRENLIRSASMYILKDGNGIRQQSAISILQRQGLPKPKRLKHTVCDGYV